MDEELAPRRGLTSRALSGALVTGLGMGLQSLVQLGVLVVLARLVKPEEFGLITAAGVVIAFCNLFVQLGVGPALIQREKLEQKHLDAAFTVSLWLGAVVCGAVLLAAPLIAEGFRMDRLTLVLRVLSANFIIAAPGVVPYSILARRLRFGMMAAMGLMSYVVGYGVIGVTLAVFDMGVWALVIASVAQMAIMTVSTVIAQRTGARLTLRMHGLRDLLGFGAGFTLAGLAGYFADNLDNMVVGRRLGAEALGYYGRAFQFLATPAVWLGLVTDRVLFPVMSRIQQERDRLGPAYRRSLALVAIGAIPVTVGIILLAPEIVRVVLGDQWDDTILPLQILALGMLPRVSSKLAKSVAKATGVVLGSAWRQSVFAVMVAAGAWLGSYRGLPGVAIGVVVAAVLNYVMMAHLTLRSTGLTWFGFLRSHGSGAAIGGVWLAIGWPCTHVLRLADLPDIAMILVMAAVFLLVLAALWILLPGQFLGKDGRWAAALIRERLRRGEHSG